MNIKIGTKVRYKTDQGNTLNLIAIQQGDNPLFNTWLCVNPNSTSKTGECTLFNCFIEDLQLGWE